MLPSQAPVILSDKVLIPLYFEERKSVALSDGTVLTSDYNAKKIPQIKEYISTAKTLHNGLLFGKPTTVKKVKASEIEHYLSQLESQSSGASNANVTDSEPSKRLHEYLQSGVEKWCSDIHIEVHENSTVIYARVDGRRILLSEIPDPSYGSQLFSYIFNSKATEKDSDFVEKDANNGHVEEILDCRDISIIDGEPSINKVKRNTRWRVAYVPAKRGGRCTFRWLDASYDIPKLDDMGWTTGHVAVLRNYLDTPSGVCIIAGKTGSGKTTTLASALNEIPVERSVVTLEDPPEFDLKKAIQIQIKPNTPVKEGGEEMRGFSYYSKQTLRHDVDVEMHGEVRDKVGAMELTRKGETGQLMFTTLHTSSAMGIAHTLTEQMHVPAAVIAAPALMRLWIYQTLVRKVCPHCSFTIERATEYYKDKQDPKVLHWLNNIEDLCDGQTQKVRFKNPDGCQKCVEGERGRTALVEMIVLDDEDREYIIKKDYLGWEKALKAKGFKDVRDHAISKIKSGMIDVVTASGKVNDLLPVTSSDIYKTFEM
ncbi:Flp pilus assembly complex ATPase component TadA [Shewanella sp. ZOR0012]|uniref:GspE/PulE family protein n=1 Tax=Shewanella sp. ZOR0012 TaxID=1339231 RepID=UPI0006483A75|nr:ATPase, T2SS/T4P/T4SS family [Shewanella sp. ZOR0012]NSM26838.1 Flp pilus assembly complex ATPase component TadA [Shewanella sp. ZOR0012]